MFKKSVSIILALLMLLSVFAIMPITAHANIYATIYTSGDWEYTIEDGHARLYRYYGTATNLVIPSTLDDYKVVAIDSGFIHSDTVSSITIPDGVEVIGSYAFSHCPKLTSINIPDSVYIIGSDILEDTPIIDDDSNYTDGLLYIGKHLIEAKKSLTGDVVVKKGTLSVATEAFCYCRNIKNITLPSGIKYLGERTFDECDSLNTLILGEGLTTINGPIKCVNLVIPTTVCFIGSEVLGQPYGAQYVYFCRLRDEISIWEMIYMSSTDVKHGHSTVWVENDDYDCYSCYGYTPKGRHRVIFKKAGSGAEPYSQVVEDNETATDPSYVWGVYDYKIVGGRWKPIEGYPTYYKDLEYYSDKKCTVPYDFNTPVTSDITIYCKDKGSTDPIVYDGYATTYDWLFWKYAPDTCTFTVERTPNFYYDDSFEEFLREAKNLVVEDSVDAIDEAIMLNSEQLETVKIAGSVKSIGADCFQCCEKLRSVKLGEGIETIGNGAFSEIPLVSEIKIPDSVKTIGDGAFLSNSDNFKLIGKAGSAAQTYAEANGIKFEAIEETEPQPTASPVTTDPQATTEPQTTTEPVETIAPATTEPQTTTEPVETTAPATTEPQTTTEPAETTAPAATEPQTTTEPVETTAPVTTEPQKTTAPAVTAKKPNPVKVTVKTKTVKLKNLKKKNQTVKAITVKNAKGKVTYKLTSVPKKIKKLTKISSKGVITINKWKKAKKGTYKFKVKITAAGNANYKPKSVTKILKIKIK